MVTTVASKRNTVGLIKEKLTPVLEGYPVRKAILFGSFAKGNPTSDSDIDLYIDTSGKLKGLDFVGLLEMLVVALERDIDLIDKSHIEENSMIMREIEKRGIVIYEKSENYSKDN